MSLLAEPNRALAAAVGGVRDPELDETLAELGLLRSAELDRRGCARIRVALTVASCPFVEHLRTAIGVAARSVPGVHRVEVDFAQLGEPERMALATRLRAERPAGPPARRVYAVASGKGGVGKSTVTANLAVALADAGQRVGVLDADVWGYSIPAAFGVRRAPVALKGLMLPVAAHGVALMSIGFFVEEDAPVLWRGPMLHKAIEQFVADVHWGALDVLLVDLPPGTGDVALSLMELLPDAVLVAVTTPQLAAQRVAARVLRLARDARLGVAGVIENMSGTVCPACGERSEPFGSGGGGRLAAALDTEVLGRVPFDPAARQAGDGGVPVVRQRPDAASARELRRIAVSLPAVRRPLLGRPLPLQVLSGQPGAGG